MLTYISIIFICKFLGIRLGKAEDFADQKLAYIKVYMQQRHFNKFFLKKMPKIRLIRLVQINKSTIDTPRKLYTHSGLKFFKNLKYFF